MSLTNKNYIIILCVIVFVFFSLKTHAQTQQIIAKTDSLLKVNKLQLAHSYLQNQIGNFQSKSLYDSIAKLTQVRSLIALEQKGYENFKALEKTWENSWISNIKNPKIKFEYFKTIANIYRQEYDIHRALLFLKKADSIFRKNNLKDSISFYINQRDIASFLVRTSTPETTLKTILPSYTYLKKHKNNTPKGYIDAAITLATVYKSSLQLDKSLTLYEEVLDFIDSNESLIEEIDFRKAVIYNNMANTKVASDFYLEGIDYLEQAVLLMKKAMEDPKSKATRVPLYTQYYHIMQGNLAISYVNIGDQEKEYQIKTHSYHQIKNKYPIGHPFYFQSIMSYIDVLIAKKEFEKAATLFNTVELSSIQANEDLAEYYYLGIFLYSQKGDCEKAYQFYQKSIPSFKNQKDLFQTFMTNAIDIATCFSTNNPEKAIAIIDHVHHLVSENKAYIGSEVEFAYKYQKVQFLLSLEKLNEAEEILNTMEKKLKKQEHSIHKANQYHLNFYLAKAKLLFEKGNKNPIFYEQALQSVKNYIIQYKKLKNTDFSIHNITVEDTYLKEIRTVGLKILLKLYHQTKDKKYLYEMINHTEQFKMAQLSENINKLSSFKRHGIPSNLYQKELDLSKKLKAINFEKGAKTLKEFRTYKKQYENLLDTLKTNYPKYYQTRFVTPDLSTTDLLKPFFKNNDILIQYLLINESWFALLVKPNSIELITLKNLNYDHLIKQVNAASKSNDFNKYKQVSEELYEGLISPFRHKMTGKKIVIIPNTTLSKLNFETLCEPSKANTFKELPYLIKEFIFSYSYHYDIYQQVSSSKHSSEEKKIKAFAPGFEEKMKQQYLAKLVDSAFLDTDYIHTLKQPFSVELAHFISKKFNGISFVDQNATESNFRKKTINSAILHIGSHSKFNETNPLFSKILFAKDPTQAMEKNENDGNLYFHELYSMDIDAQCTLLLGCETGIGKEQIGEGMLSLSHALLYAGCPASISSLWKIDEKSSNELITEFYRTISENNTPIHIALHQAKLDYLEKNTSELCNPFYWGGLIPQGQVDAIVNIQKASSPIWYFLIVVCITIFTLFIIRKFKFSK